jgi:hypothetical protein
VYGPPPPRSVRISHSQISKFDGFNYEREFLERVCIGMRRKGNTRLDFQPTKASICFFVKGSELYYKHTRRERNHNRSRFYMLATCSDQTSGHCGVKRTSEGWKSGKDNEGIPVHCFCPVPEDNRSVQCCSCKQWYRVHCVNVPSYI